MGIQTLYFEQITLNETPTVHGPTEGGTVYDSRSAANAPETGEAIAELERSNAEILAAYPANAMRRAVEEKLAAKGALKHAATEEGLQSKAREPRGRIISFARRGSIAGLAAAACCVLAVSYLSVNTLIARNAAVPGGTVAGTVAVAERVKGSGPRIFAYLKEETGARLLAPETRVAAGDTVQISYVADGDPFGAIVSVDGAGNVTQHFPESGDRSGDLSQEGEIPLDFSYRLDNAPRFERFFLVSGKSSFTMEWFKKRISESSVLQGLDKAALPETVLASLSDTLPPGVHIAEILLRK